MSRTLKTFLQYAVIFLITGLLIWFSLRGLTGENKAEYLLHTWQTADKGWLLAMAVVAILSHIARAQRWRMLLEPSGYKSKLKYTFLSLMVGYLVNLVIPRGGEVSRCYNLYKLDKTPVEISFGTVVTERIVDLVCLLILIALAFLVESTKLLAFIETLPIGDGNGSSKIKAIALVAAGLLVLGALVVLFVMKNKKVNEFVVRTWHGFKDGLLSIFRLKRKGLFLCYSVAIWLLYFVMSYTVILAFPETKHLGVGAVLSLFAIGSIAMAAPLPGGTGSYHVLVPQGLVFLYAIPQPDAIAFTFIFHGWQTAIMIVGGAISLVVTSFLLKNKGQPR
ncbi:MAG: flippase-like domain-containing protein [Bacteroidota bacterium]|nr:flippase-like domain-containing protein [Bacteroidota bacterium]